MPSINEVWEQALQINANLATIHNDLVGLQNCCGATNAGLDQLLARADETNDWLAETRDLLADGFSTVADGISGIQARQDNLIRLSEHQVEQNRTIICVLENISRNTCTLVNEAAVRRGLQERIAGSVEAMAHMAASVHPEAALTHRREREIREEVKRCCPPPEPEPPCEHEPCEAPEERELPRPPSFEGFPRRASEVRRVERPTGPR